MHVELIGIGFGPRRGLTSIARGPSLASRPVRPGEVGVALLEVLIGGVLLVIVLAGIALMFSEGRSYVVAEGDDRVAVFLAQQKLEKLRTLGFSCLPVGGPGVLGTAMTNIAGCSDNADTQLTRTYNEALTSAGQAFGGTSQSFARQTIVSLGSVDAPNDTKTVTVTVVPSVRKGDQIVLSATLTAHF